MSSVQPSILVLAETEIDAVLISLVVLLTLVLIASFGYIKKTL